MNTPTQPKKVFSAEEMAALESTPQAIAARADYDAKHGSHDALSERIATATPAPGAALAALRPKCTSICGLTLPPVTAAHYVLIQELDLAFYRYALLDQKTPMKFIDFLDAIYFFTLDADQVERLIEQGEAGARIRGEAMNIAKRISPGELRDIEAALIEHLTAGNSTRVHLASTAEPGEDTPNPSVRAMTPPMASAGSSISSPAAPASSTPARDLTTS